MRKTTIMGLANQPIFAKDKFHHHKCSQFLKIQTSILYVHMCVGNPSSFYLIISSRTSVVLESGLPSLHHYFNPSHLSTFACVVLCVQHTSSFFNFCSSKCLIRPLLQLGCPGKAWIPIKLNTKLKLKNYKILTRNYKIYRYGF